MAEHLVIVGKVGAGKSTTAVNLAAALAEAGRRVALIGYDPRRSSTATLRGGSRLLPVPGSLVSHYAAGFKGALCIEAGELTLAGEAVQSVPILALPLFADFHPEFVIHDLSREPDATFALPTAVAGVPRLLVVTSGDMASINVVNELFSWLNTAASCNCRFGGVVVNNLKGPLYESITADFVAKTGTTTVASIPHSLMVSVSDFYDQPLVAAAPYSHNSFIYRKLAKRVIDSALVPRPLFLDKSELTDWAVKWKEIITELETGIVKDGSHI
jgi:nitrogenase iron protein NifH